jgi:parallel beta helix pectate lyase-like protein
MRRGCHLRTTRPRVEPLEDRLLLSTCHVTRLVDADAGTGLRGTLRYCINYANNNPGPDTIDFKVTGTIQLASWLPDLASDITITGPGADLLAVSGQGTPLGGQPILSIDTGATVTISGLTIANGITDGAPGGIANRGTLTVKDCTVANNKNELGDPNGSGGGIWNSGEMTISGCTISGNGVVFPHDDGEGGGIYNYYSGEMYILNSTISGNYVEPASTAEGGGIANAGSLDIRFSTVTNNEACDGWGIYNATGLFVYDTIVAGNIKGKFCDGGQDMEGGYTGSANLIGGDPMLGPLAYNGGHTQTHAVLPGSPALDAGDNAGAN